MNTFNFIKQIYYMQKHICISFLLMLLFSSTCSNFIQVAHKLALNEKADSYNITTSKDYAILGIASYCDRKCLEGWTCEITKNYLKNDVVTNVTFLMGTLTRAAGYVAYDRTKNIIVVSLRGSANAENWVSDFSFDSVQYSKCKGCKVHIGFMEDYKSIQKSLNQAVDKLVKEYPTASIVTAGHSMGAALSVIVAIQLKIRLNKVVQIHNLGQPRVGNVDFAQFVHLKVDRAYRLVHNRDLIPHLPPTEFGYHHSAYEVFWDQPFETYTICNQSGEDKSCSNKYAPQYSAADHSFYFWDLGKIFKC